MGCELSWTPYISIWLGFFSSFVMFLWFFESLFDKAFCAFNLRKIPRYIVRGDNYRWQTRFFCHALRNTFYEKILMFQRSSFLFSLIVDDDVWNIVNRQSASNPSNLVFVANETSLGDYVIIFQIDNSDPNIHVSVISLQCPVWAEFSSTRSSCC